MTLCKQYVLLSFSFVLFCCCAAQPLHQLKPFTRQDSLRGTITPERAWWDVTHYDITVEPAYETKTITGVVVIDFKVINDGRRMQVDLQLPMKLEAARWKDQNLTFQRDSNVFYISFPENLKAGQNQQVSFRFSGKPREAVHPPWDGGWIWKQDAAGNPWMTVACQGLGASVWYPCKDHQSDEPDSARLRVITPGNLVGVGNGRYEGKSEVSKDKTMYSWVVKNPINNYNIVPYIGKYIDVRDSFQGTKGRLDIDYWVLESNKDKALSHLAIDVQPMLKSFEHWFGPYPFYEDGYKLVESPHLGMEHQSAIAYGNQFKKGYAGKDLSTSGWGAKWDFIVVHESGHEWFGNSITTKDIADMWVHEGFTNYSETLFIESLYGKEAGSDYVTGLRKLIQNDIPIIGAYGVNKEGSSDMYYKASNMIHTIRQVIDNDQKFREILLGLNKKFYHRTVTGTEVEKYISDQSGKDFSGVFEQYLRTTEIPVLEYKIDDKTLSYRWNNCVEGFAMPVKVNLQKTSWLSPKKEWKTVALVSEKSLEADRNFFIKVKKV